MKDKAKVKTELILDSGAFSAWTQGEQINLKEYMSFIKDNINTIDYYFNLDVIPGKRGVSTSTKDIEEAAAQSFANYQIMRKSGLNPIPVFHHGEDEKWLHKMLDMGCTYIAVGGNAKKPANVRRDWLDRIFTLLTNENGEAVVRVHGLGVASFELLRRYPWASCDATSWAMQAAYGCVLIPRYRSNKPDYTVDPHEVTISTKPRDNGEIMTNHYNNLGPSVQRRVVDFLENHAGVNYKQATTDYMERSRAIVYLMLQVEATLQDIRFTHRKKGFITVYSGVRAA